MISFEEFEKAVTTYLNECDFEEKLSNLGFDCDVYTLIKLKENYLRILSLSLGLEVNNDFIGYNNDLEYWVYELKCGKRVKNYFSPEDDEWEGLGTNLNKVYNYLISQPKES